MKHGSLFSGIGGFDLAAEWMGWENVFHCEWNDFGKRVLSYYWPNAISYNDITKTDFTIHRGRIDILTGGFPCQPYSAAGKRRGKDDERHLWPEMLRAIREISPRWVVGENVFGIVNWNGGLVFDEVQADLEAEGYEVQAFVLPACAVNAPHRRDRVWFVAHTDNGSKRQAVRTQKENAKYCSNGGNGLSPDPNSPRFQVNTCGELRSISEQDAASQGRTTCGTYAAGIGWEKFPTQSPVCRRDDGLSYRLDGITFSKWRNESIKAAGNAVVPQVVYQIFQAIQQYEHEKKNAKHPRT